MKNILWFDDTIDKLASHIEFIETLEFTVKKVDDPNELELICSKDIGQYDVIIMDVRVVHLGNSNWGPVFIETLLQKIDYKGIIIFFTVLNESNDKKLHELLLKHKNIFHIRKGVTVTGFYEEFKKIINNQ